jgi:hypothetical protein
VLFFGELILKLLFLGSSSSLADLLELSLNVDNPLLLSRIVLQQVGTALSPVCQRLPQQDNIVSTI